MKVKEVLKIKDRETITVDPGTNVTAAMKVLLDNKVSCLPIVDDQGSLVGILSDKDIFRKVYNDPDNFRNSPVGELMSTNLIVGLPDDDMTYIAGIMTQNRIRHVPIVTEQQIVGLISVGDVVKLQIENVEIENRYLKQYIDGGYPG